MGEATHNRLTVTFGKDNPDTHTLIEKLKYIDSEAQCSLRWIRETFIAREESLQTRLKITADICHECIWETI
ncbi:hypothetical protein COOONC_24238 [Cooperia oncophora]